MRHARPDDLDRIEPLLEALRALPDMKERSRGVFYRSGKAFLHFHEHEGALLADLRAGADWDRLDARPVRWSALVKRVARALKA
jgi:hypothetical protein